MWGCALDSNFIRCAAASYSLPRFLLLIVAVAALMCVLVAVVYQVYTSVIRRRGLNLKR